MASAYVSEHADAFAGIVLLGAYASADLSETHLRALCLYGSEDGVLNREKYEQNRGNLPPDFTETVIEGGCHAGFGAYGPQKGDGVHSAVCLGSYPPPCCERWGFRGEMVLPLRMEAGEKTFSSS